MSIQRGLEEPRDHGRVCGVGILPGAEHVEVAKRHAFERPRAGERQHVLLAGELGRGIRRTW